MKFQLFTLLLGILLLISCEKQEKKITVRPQNPHLKEFTKEYLQEFEKLLMTTGTPGAGLVIIKDTTILHLNGHGLKSNSNKDKVDKNTVFRVGSLSKGFASVLAGILVDKGQLKWTDKVHQHIPAFVLKDSLQSNRVNLIHLLSQSSGLPYHAYTNLVEAGISVENIAKEFRKVKLIGKEGEIYAYQNAAYSLIGSVMEKKQGMPLSQIFEEELFLPLQAKNASTSFEEIDNGENIALPHQGGTNNWHKRKISKKYYNAIPAGGINASIADMGQWLQLLLGNRSDIISTKTLDEIFIPRINTNNKRRYFHDWPMVEEAYYGLGWRVLTCTKDTLIYHGGYVNGYRGEILINRKEKLGICLLVNAPSDLANKAIPLFLKEYELKRDSINVWEQRQKATEVEK